MLKETLRHEQDEHLHTQQRYADLVRTEKDLRKKFVQLEKEKLASSEQIETLKKQMKTLQEDFERSKSEEVQRLKRDIGLELYRKQEAEKKCRILEDKLRQEQTEHQKIQLDLTKTRHELNTFKVKFDAVQFELDEMKKKPPVQPNESIKIIDDRPSTRSKRRTDEEVRPFDIYSGKERKKIKRVTDEHSIESNPYGEIEAEPEPAPKVKVPIKRTRTKNKPIEQKSSSPIYATIERKRLPVATSPMPTQIVETPKTSTFKRIQSFFRATPSRKIREKGRPMSHLLFRLASTNSTRMTRVTQVKTTTIAFGSSTPTNRVPPATTPPKSKYNLRTRIFQNPTSTEKKNDEVNISFDDREEPRTNIRSLFRRNLV